MLSCNLAEFKHNAHVNITGLVSYLSILFCIDRIVLQPLRIIKHFIDLVTDYLEGNVTVNQSELASPTLASRAFPSVT